MRPLAVAFALLCASSCVTRDHKAPPSAHLSPGTPSSPAAAQETPALEIGVDLGKLQQDVQDPSRYRVLLPVGASALGVNLSASAEAQVFAQGKQLQSGETWRLKLQPGLNEFEFIAVEGDRRSRRVLSAWSESAVTYIKANDTESGDLFGEVSLSSDGRVLAVGAHGHDGKRPPCEVDECFNPNYGAVYILKKEGERWSHSARLSHSVELTDDNFGEHLSLSADGKTLAVGQPHPHEGFDTDERRWPGRYMGDVNVFRESDGWHEQAALHAVLGGGDDRFGHVALSGDGQTLAVGAPRDGSAFRGIQAALRYERPGASIPESGAVYVYRRDEQGWHLNAFLKPPLPQREELFGLGLSLSHDGKTLAVGAFSDDSGEAEGGGRGRSFVRGSGAAYVFRRSGETWVQEAYLKSPRLARNAYFGLAVALSADGSTLAVNAPSEGSEDQLRTKGRSRAQVGAAYIFRRHASVWTNEARLAAPALEPNGSLGGDLALSADGSTAAVGACDRANTSGPNVMGEVHVFHRQGGVWSFGRTFRASAPDSLDYFGCSVALSADGRVLAVGAEREDSARSGDPADNTAWDSGAVYVFEALDGPSPQTP